MARTRSILVAVLLLLAYGSGGLRALHGLSHSHHVAPDAAMRITACAQERAAVRCGARGVRHDHSCDAGRSRPGPLHQSDQREDPSGNSTRAGEESSSRGGSEHGEAPSDAHGSCGLCEMLASPVLIVAVGPLLASIPAIEEETLAVTDDVARASANPLGLGARGPPTT